LPTTRPVLDVVFPLDRRGDRFVALEVYQPRQPIALCEAADDALSVLETPAGEIIRYARVERPVGPISHHVHPPSLAHLTLLPHHNDLVDGRDGPTAVHFRQFGHRSSTWLLTVVITGLVPVIQASYDIGHRGPMDGRIESGHDDDGAASTPSAL